MYLIKWNLNRLPNPVVGSSQNKMVGLIRSSVAKAKRFFSPPDNIFPLSESPIIV